MKGWAALALVGALTLAGCASVARTASYESGFGNYDARNVSTAYVMLISAHPSDDTLLINPEPESRLIPPARPGEAVVRRVGTEFLGDTGCQVGEVRAMARPYYEADFTCPAGFDLRAAVAAQREALRGGAPLRR